MSIGAWGVAVPIRYFPPRNTPPAELFWRWLKSVCTCKAAFSSFMPMMWRYTRLKILFAMLSLVPMPSPPPRSLPPPPGHYDDNDISTIVLRCSGVCR